MTSSDPPTPFQRMLAELNPEQRRAATFGDGPLLVLAGAGTGKTRTLAARVACLLERGVPPERLLLLTFSRRAAREMLRRVSAICGDRRARRVLGGTFHSVGQHLLRTYANRAGLNEAFTILDRPDAADLIDLCRESLGLRSGSKSARGRRFPSKGTLISIYSRAVSTGAELHDTLQQQFPWVAEHEDAIKQVFQAYELRKQQQDVLDFDDLLGYWRALTDDPVLGPEIASRWDHVLVDEYQDTNRVQRAIILGLRRDDPRLTVVGDDGQSIYAFRGATVENILGFPADFPDAETITLEQSYRSTEPVLQVCNAVQGDAVQGFKKQLWSGRESQVRPVLARVFDEDEQAAYVVQEVLRRREEGILLRKQAVLFRTAHHSDLLEVELGRHKIPFHKFGGLRFTDAAHVKDVIAYLRILENPADQTAWFRVLKLFDGVGPKTAARALEHIEKQGYRLEALADCGAPAAVRQDLSALGELLGGLSKDPVGRDLPVEIDRLRALYEPILRARYDRPESRLEDLEILGHVASTSASRREFLAEISLDPPSGSGDQAGAPHLDEDWLVLSTIHSAKGLEWEAVTVLNGSDGMIPSDLSCGSPEQIEEERRLFYVALTRAKRLLTVVFPQRYHPRERRRIDWHLYPKLTRFISPATEALFQSVVREAPRAKSRASAGPNALTDLRAQARSRWA